MMNHNNNVIMLKKCEIKSIIKDFREVITTYGFKDRKSLLKSLKRTLRSHEKIVNDENEDDSEYFKGSCQLFKQFF